MELRSLVAMLITNKFLIAKETWKRRFFVDGSLPCLCTSRTLIFENAIPKKETVGTDVEVTRLNIHGAPLVTHLLRHTPTIIYY